MADVPSREHSAHVGISMDNYNVQLCALSFRFSRWGAEPAANLIKEAPNREWKQTNSLGKAGQDRPGPRERAQAAPMALVYDFNVLRILRLQ